MSFAQLCWPFWSDWVHLAIQPWESSRAFEKAYMDYNLSAKTCTLECWRQWCLKDLLGSSTPPQLPLEIDALMIAEVSKIWKHVFGTVSRKHVWLATGFLGVYGWTFQREWFSKPCLVKVRHPKRVLLPICCFDALSLYWSWRLELMGQIVLFRKPETKCRNTEHNMLVGFHKTH